MAHCIFIHRSSEITGEATAYFIQKEDNDVERYMKSQLIVEMRQGKIEVDNLKLDGNRIIELDTSYNKVDMAKYEGLIARAKMVGNCLTIKVPEKKGGNLEDYNRPKYCYAIESGRDASVKIIIPDNVEVLTDQHPFGIAEFDAYLDLGYNIVKIIGGKGIKEMETTFHSIWCNTLDLTEFSTESLEYMRETFAYSKAKVIKFRNFNTQKVIMDRVFYRCKSKIIGE